MKKYFFKQNPSFWLVEMDLLARRNSFILFRVFPCNGIFEVFPRHWLSGSWFLQKDHILTNKNVFIPSFFLLMENITQIWGRSNFKDEPYSCYPVDTGRELNIHKTFRRHLMYVQFTSCVYGVLVDTNFFCFSGIFQSGKRASV